MTRSSKISNQPLHDSPTIAELLAGALDRYADRPCLAFDDKVMGYREVRETAGRYQQAQRELGLARGDRVSVLSKNRPELIINQIAMLCAGTVLTPLHPLGSFHDQAHVLDDSDVAVLLFDPDVFGERAAQLREHRPGLRLMSLGPSEIGEDFLAAVDRVEESELETVSMDGEDLCAVVYTGGSTGVPKGVLINERMWRTMTMIQMTEWDLPDPLRMLIVTPLSHAALSLLAPVLLRGGSFRVLSGFDPDSFFNSVEEHRSTATLMVPAMLYALQDHPRCDTADMSSMEFIIYGASPMNPTRLAKAIGQWGHVFYQFYGQTEAPTVIANLSREDHDLSKPWRLESCGRPAPWIRVECLDESDQPVETGESGEICVRGPLVTTGYHGQPEKSAELLANDWLHTGDIGRFDREGFLYIVDRAKDMIISGGFNVFPREVEDVLATHPAVSIAAVIGVPDPKFGEAVKAVVTLASTAAASDELTRELQRLVKDAKGSVYTPKTVDYVTNIGLTALGKPDKLALRARYWDANKRQIS